MDPTNPFWIFLTLALIAMALVLGWSATHHPAHKRK